MGSLSLALDLHSSSTCFGWFGNVIHESEAGLYNKQLDVSHRWSMSLVHFSEVMFFAAVLFGALFYARVFSVPWLGDMDNAMIWQGYDGQWLTAGPYLCAERRLRVPNHGA